MEKLVGRREYGMSRLGIAFNGCWVVRDERGEYYGHDRYRTDLIVRFSDYEITFIEN